MSPDELKAWRTAHGLTQMQLSILLGVGTTTVARWEQGISPISLAIELALKHLGHSLEVPS